MKISRSKIEIAMAKKCYNTPKLAEVYEVSRSRMNIILNSLELTTKTVGRLAKALNVTDIIK